MMMVPCTAICYQISKAMENYTVNTENICINGLRELENADQRIRYKLL